MPKLPLQAFDLSILVSIVGLALGCSSTSVDGGASSGALENLPGDADECKGRDCDDGPDDDRCLDWYDGDECQYECPSPPEGEIRVFEECGEIHIASCKDLSNVVLRCCDDDVCEDHKIDNLNEQRLSLDPLEDWDCQLEGLCVKAGPNFGSGVCDGPGYGEHIPSEDFIQLVEDCDGAGGSGGGGAGGDTGTGGTGGPGEIIVQ